MHSIIVKLQFQDFARAARRWTHALTFNIAYDTNEWSIISVRLMVFSNTSTQILYISISIMDICLNSCSEKRKFQSPLSQLVIMLFTWNFEGCLTDNQSCFTQNLKFLALREPVFLKIHIWPKSVVNRILDVLYSRQVFFSTLLGFDFGVM